MGDDDKIKELQPAEHTLANAKQLFLNIEAKLIEESFKQKNIYYLEQELPKLNKNKNVLARYLVLGFIVTFILIGFFGVKLIQWEQEDVEVTIDDFRSFRLSEIVGKVDDYRNKVESLKAEINKWDRELQDRYRSIEESKTSQLSLLKEKNLSAADYQKEVQKIEAEALTKKKVQKAKYEQQVVSLKKEKLEVEKDLSSIEKEVGEDVEKVVIDNSEELIKVRVKKIKEEYETKEKAIHYSYKKQIGDYKNGFNHYMDRSGQVGIVLNVDDSGVPQIYIHPLYEIKKNAKGYIIDKDNKIKAEIIINKKQEYFEGRIRKLINKKEKITALDNVVLIL